MKYIHTAIGSLPIHFGMRAIGEFSKITGVEFNTAIAEPDKLGNIETVAELARFGLNEGARREKEKKRYELDEIWDLFDEKPELFREVFEYFAESTIALTSKLAPPTPNQEQTPQQTASQSE